MKRFLKILIWFVAVSGALRAIGALVGRRFEQGATAADGDEVRLAAIWGGRDFHSTAAALRSLHAKAMLGGINLDLSSASLHPEGAELRIEVMAGGVNLEVPAAWRVEVTEQLTAGDVAVSVADPTDLASDAPLLAVIVSGTAGGVNIEASKSS